MVTRTITTAIHTPIQVTYTIPHTTIAMSTLTGQVPATTIQIQATTIRPTFITHQATIAISTQTTHTRATCTHPRTSRFCKGHGQHTKPTIDS